MSAQGKRVVILAEKQYEDLELWYPRLRLEEAGFEVIVAGTGDKSYSSKHGYPVQTDARIGDLSPEDFAGVVVPGGWAPDYLRRSEAVKGFIRAMMQQGKMVAAICHAGSVLVSAGILRGRRLTSVSAIKDDLVNAGAEWVDEEAVIDGNLVSSRRPDDLPAFMRAALEVLEGQGRRGAGARASIEGELVSLRLQRASFEYMLDMLGRMPHAREYHGEGLDTTTHDLQSILQDFAREADPKGSLEAESPTVIDVTPQDGSYVARGNARLYDTLIHGEVPNLERV